MKRIIKDKSAFAFSLFAFFLVFLIYGFGNLYFFEGEYSQNVNFNNARILFINEEVGYFKDVYVKNSISFSLYNVLNSLLNYSSSNYTLNKNYNKLNELIEEGLIYGSFNNVSQLDMENKTISNFISIFQDNFKSNYRSNLDYKIVKLNVFERTPYYVSLQVIMQYNITTDDNISSWNILDEFEISIPIFELNDPEFLIQDNLSYSIRAAEYYKSGSNWTKEVFNETIFNVYSSVYFEPNYKYSIGTSFINRLLNFSIGSYKDTLLSLSFDYDNEKNGVYDSSLNSPLGVHFGNTKLLLNFDNSTANDLSSYKNNGVVNGAVIELNNCVNGNCYSFNGVNNYINISSNSNLNLSSNNFTISLFVFVVGNKSSQSIISFGTKDYNSFELSTFNFTGLQIFGEVIGDGNPWDLDLKTSSNVLVQNSWNHISVVKSNSNFFIYVNGVEVESTNLLGNLLVNNNEIHLGTSFNLSNFFEGLIDEVSLYSKALNGEEVANLYSTKIASFIDYENSLFDKGIVYDGIDDYSIIDDNINLQNKNFSIGVWFNKYSNDSSFLIGKKNFSDQEWYLNFENNKLIFNLYNTTNNKNSISSVSTISNNDWTYIVITYNVSNSNLRFYLNSVIDNVVKFRGVAKVTNLNLTLGNDFNLSNYFYGLIDEVKIYNRTLSDDEISLNYYNYNSVGKGCCNYLTLINPNNMGYNISPIYDNNISYSSKLFYDYYKRGNDFNNISLVKLENFTSNITTENYYNFNVDFCLMKAYDIFDYAGKLNVIQGENGTISCLELIKRGIY